ncbi:MAG: hypothetical protein AAGD06_24740 [Acidobacteriota bacterium]
MTSTSEEASWAAEIAAAGAVGDEVDELLEYNRNHFDLKALDGQPDLPLDDEPFVDTWRRWVEEGDAGGAYGVLRRHLPQLSFPIREGISRSDGYRAATLSGADPSTLESATGLDLEDPDRVELSLYRSLAGHVPVLVMRRREDFVTLARALGRRNEPAEIPDSMGALMVSGYNNWFRIRELRERYEAQPEEERDAPTWREAFAAIRQRKELFQDRFVLLSDGPYSAVRAEDLGLDDGAWREASLKIRRDHECAHYFTRRLFGSMRNNLLDELIADYAGIVAALGHYRADWFLRFIGLEDYPTYRAGGRLDLYRGDPPLSDGAFRVLQTLVKRAAESLQAFDDGRFGAPTGGDAPAREPRLQGAAIAALATLRLDELAADDGAERMARAFADVEQRLV